MVFRCIHGSKSLFYNCAIVSGKADHVGGANVPWAAPKTFHLHRKHGTAAVIFAAKVAAEEMVAVMASVVALGMSERKKYLRATIIRRRQK